MPSFSSDDLIAAASKVVGAFTCSEDAEAGSVASALITISGQVFTGICVDTRCSLGHCAESSAISEMLKARETQIAGIVAINGRGEISPPCGRCRELIRQVAPENWNTGVVVSREQIVSLADLMPFSRPSGTTSELTATGP
jgi:cytidine deaminase